MSDYMISMFIDDELSLDEKIEFVETVHRSRSYLDETVGLLEQEKLLTTLDTQVPDVQVMPREKKPWFVLPWLPPLSGFAAALVLVALFALLHTGPGPVSGEGEVHRFVLYSPDTGQAEIIGTFTNWSPVPMHRVGSGDYWSLELKLPPGEHRYSFLFENGRQIADPTVSLREQDDFGGENSILNISSRTI